MSRNQKKMPHQDVGTPQLLHEAPPQCGRTVGTLTFRLGKEEVTVTLVWIAVRSRDVEGSWSGRGGRSGHRVRPLPAVTCPLSLGFLIYKAVTALQDCAVSAEVMPQGLACRTEDGQGLVSGSIVGGSRAGKGPALLRAWRCPERSGGWAGVIPA